MLGDSLAGSQRTGAVRGGLRPVSSSAILERVAVGLERQIAPFSQHTANGPEAFLAETAHVRALRTVGDRWLLDLVLAFAVGRAVPVSAGVSVRGRGSWDVGDAEVGVREVEGVDKVTHMRAAPRSH